MNASKYIFCIVFSWLFVWAHAQETDLTIIPDWKLKSLAKTADLDGEIYLAIDYYEEYITRKGENEEIYASLANLYWLAKDYINASDLYYQLMDWNQKEGLYILRYGLLQKNLNKPAAAYTFLERYLRLFLSDKKDSEAYQKIQMEMEGCEYARSHPANPRIEIIRLPNNVNYPHVETNPVPWGDSLLFSSIRIEQVEFEESEKPKSEIYLAKEVNDTIFNLFPHDLPFTDALYDVGNLAFNHNKTLAAFTKCSKRNPTYYRCEIYLSKLDSGKWTKPEPLNSINTHKKTATQPTFAIGPDGKQMLYFVSDKDGGFGGKDIWYAFMDAGGKFSNAKNCGKDLNTAGDEQTPWYHNEKKTLYFSTTGLPGYGASDIFSINGYATKWASPRNIGAPINSGADDLYFIEKDSLNSFFTSNREGVNSLRGATCCDDIFRAKQKQIINIEVAGNVGYAIQDGNATDTKVGLYKDLGGKKVLVNETRTDASGNYRFKLDPNEKYNIIAEKDGFLKGAETISTEGISSSKKLKPEAIKLLIDSKEPIIVKNIYYPFDKDYVTEQSKITIDTTIYDILVANPTIQVEISSHTDWFGSDLYNEDLSLRRAQSVVRYLIEKGIPEDRLVAAGYGEKKPIAPNQNPNGTDNPEGRAKNRRTEFRVIGYLPQYEEVIYED